MLKAKETDAGTQLLPIGEILAFHAARDPDRPMLTVGDRTVSRAELDRSSNRWARLFRDLGVRKDDIVTIGLPNSIEAFEAIFATWKCGATPNPISWRLPVVEAQGIVDLARSAVVVGGPQVEAKHYLPEGYRPDEAISDEPLPDPEVATYWKAMSSGGSTGRPKIIVAHREAVADPFATMWNLRVDGVTLIPGPFYNNGPFMNSVMALFSGNHVIVMPRFDPVAAVELIQRHKVDFTFLVPTMMNRIWRLGPEVLGRYDLSSLNAVFHSASMCPAWLKQAWIDLIGAEKIIEAYGGTEGQGFAVITGTQWLDHQGSVGQALPGSRIQILDPDGRELPPGEVGEIFFLPDDPGEKTYHYLGAERREVGAAGSVGDMGYLDADGWLFIADRRTDMIVTGGANVYPAEVEAALEQHPAIQSSIVVGLPDEDLIAIVHAIVQVDPDRPAPSEADLVAFLKQRIVTYKIPRSFEFVSENLRDDAGKARRSQMREERVKAGA